MLNLNKPIAILAVLSSSFEYSPFSKIGVRGHTGSKEQFQYDYCSYFHSQHVVDRIESEVRPIFEKYGVAMLQTSD